MWDDPRKPEKKEMKKMDEARVETVQIDIKKVIESFREENDIKIHVNWVYDFLLLNEHSDIDNPEYYVLCAEDYVKCYNRIKGYDTHVYGGYQAGGSTTYYSLMYHKKGSLILVADIQGTLRVLRLNDASQKLECVRKINIVEVKRNRHAFIDLVKRKNNQIVALSKISQNYHPPEYFSSNFPSNVLLIDHNDDFSDCSITNLRIIGSGGHNICNKINKIRISARDENFLYVCGGNINTRYGKYSVIYKFSFSDREVVKTIKIYDDDDLGIHDFFCKMVKSKVLGRDQLMYVSLGNELSSDESNLFIFRNEILEKKIQMFTVFSFCDFNDTDILCGDVNGNIKLIRKIQNTDEEEVKDGIFWKFDLLTNRIFGGQKRTGQRSPNPHHEIRQIKYFKNKVYFTYQKRFYVYSIKGGFPPIMNLGYEMMDLKERISFLMEEFLEDVEDNHMYNLQLDFYDGKGFWMFKLLF